MIDMLAHATTEPPVLAHLMFRDARGSLTVAGYWMIVVGVFMLVASIANLAGRGPGRRLARLIPTGFRFAWGALGLLGGAFFIGWPLMAAPGRLY